MKNHMSFWTTLSGKLIPHKPNWAYVCRFCENWVFFQIFVCFEFKHGENRFSRQSPCYDGHDEVTFCQILSILSIFSFFHAPDLQKVNFFKLSNAVRFFEKHDEIHDGKTPPPKALGKTSFFDVFDAHFLYFFEFETFSCTWFWHLCRKRFVRDDFIKFPVFGPVP